MKKLLIGCGGLFAAFLLLGACGMIVMGGLSDDSDSTSSGGSSREVKAKIGETVKAGDLEYTVLKAEAKKSVEKPFGGTQEPGAGQFIVVEIQVKNTGKEKITMDSNLTKLKDKEGAEYDAEPTLTDGFFLEPLNPNATKKAELIFDVTDNPVESFVFIGEGGFLSTKKVEIKLSE